MKNIIVTGTSRGIGFELSKVFADKGHQVLALSRNDKPINKLARLNLHAMPFDLCNLDDYIRVENFVNSHWKHVDVLVNNAGMVIHKPFKETSFKDFQEVYMANVFGVSELTKRVLPYMRQNAHVVNISSMGGVQGSLKFPGLSAYSSSKGALITLTELLAEEYKENGPSFNVLALGAVQTEMLEEAFPGYKAPTSAREMAEYIAEFALNGHKYYNGKLLQVSKSTP